jgi:hypothetical protein
VLRRGDEALFIAVYDDQSYGGSGLLGAAHHRCPLKVWGGGGRNNNGKWHDGGAHKSRG